MEELLQQILSRLDSMEKGQQHMSKRLDTIEQDMTTRLAAFEQGMTTRLTAFEQDITTRLATFEQDMTTRLATFEQDMTKRLAAFEQDMTKRLAIIEQDMASKIQQDENSRLIQAMRHNLEEVNAQLHSVGHNLDVLTGKAAAKEDIALLDSKFDLLNARLFNHEAELNRHIKVAK
ncbi:MAG: hypothetical protein ABFC84_14490 [Veillonellales bacterium]